MAATLPASHYENDKMSRSEPTGRPPERRQSAPWADTVFSALAHGAAILTLLLLAGGVARDGREAAKLAIKAGIDMSMNDSLYGKELPGLLKAGEILAAPRDEMVELAQLADAERRLHVADLQIIADMAVGIFVVVALGQIAQPPAEALVAGVVLARRAIAIATPVAETLADLGEQRAVHQHRATFAHRDVVCGVKAQCADVAEGAIALGREGPGGLLRVLVIDELGAALEGDQAGFANAQLLAVLALAVALQQEMQLGRGEAPDLLGERLELGQHHAVLARCRSAHPHSASTSSSETHTLSKKIWAISCTAGFGRPLGS